MKLRISSILVAAVFLLVAGIATAASALECTDGVHSQLKWTANIKANAKDWPDAALKLKFKVNTTPASCTSSSPCVVSYPKDYGSEINKTNGHVAVLYSCNGNNCLIGDAGSPGICGNSTTFKKCDKPHFIDFKKAHVIHQN